MPEVMTSGTCGPVGNDRTDDTEAFQKALDDAASAFRYVVRCFVDHLEVMNGWHAGLLNTKSSDGNWLFENTVTNCLYSLGKDSANAKGGFAIDLQDAEECYIHSNAFKFNGTAHVKEGMVGNNSIHHESIHHNSLVNGKIGIWSNGSRGRWDHNMFDCLFGCNFRVVGNFNSIDGNSFFQPGGGGPAGSASYVALDWGATGNSIIGNKVYTQSMRGRTRSLVYEMFGNTAKNLIALNHSKLNNFSLAKGVTETSGQGNTYVGNIT